MPHASAGQRDSILFFVWLSSQHLLPAAAVCEVLFYRDVEASEYLLNGRLSSGVQIDIDAVQARLTFVKLIDRVIKCQGHLCAIRIQPTQICLIQFSQVQWLQFFYAAGNFDEKFCLHFSCHCGCCGNLA